MSNEEGGMTKGVECRRKCVQRGFRRSAISSFSPATHDSPSRYIELADETLGVNLPGPSPGLLAGLVTGFHREGAHVLFADGSVKLLSNKTSPEVLRDMLRATDN